MMASASPSRFSNVISFFLLLSRFSKAHCLCVYPRHSSRKCLTVLVSALQAGHFVLSALLNLLRYLFSGTCPMYSCVMRLADLRDKLALLILWRKLVEGELLSVLVRSFPHLDFFHFLFHFRLISAFLLLCTAKGLIVSERFKKVGRRFLSELRPSAALFASLSADSLPGIPMCPAVHLSVSKYFLCLVCFCSMYPRRMISRAALYAGFLKLVSNASMAAWLSVPIVM